MFLHDQPLPDFRISPAGHYNLALNRLATDSKVSFEHFETPGWSSIIHSPSSADQFRQDSKLDHRRILEKLNRMKGVDISEGQFSKIRLNNQDKQGNVMVYQQLHNSRRSGPLHPNKENVQANQGRSLGQGRANETEPSFLKESVARSGRSGSIVKNKSTQSTNNLGILAKEKRFKQISVHEHLYLQSKRLQTKRAMGQIIDEEFKRKSVLLFTPKINEKSYQLAESKFSRIKESIRQEQEASEELKRSRKNETKDCSSGNARPPRQQFNYTTLNRLFYFLTQGRPLLTRPTVHAVVEDLPLSCIRCLEGVLGKVFNGAELTWLEFLSLCNDKEVLANRQGLLVVMEKWFGRRDQQ